MIIKEMAIMQKSVFVLQLLSLSLFCSPLTAEELILPDTVDIKEFENAYSNIAKTDPSPLLESEILVNDDIVSEALNADSEVDIDYYRLNDEQQKALSNTDQSYDNGCAIWLCLPAGFPGDQCRAPHNEMLRRIKNGKFPLPSFSSCMTNYTINGLSLNGLSNSTFSAKFNEAAYIPSQKICTSYSEETVYTPYGPSQKKTCLSYGNSEASYVKDRHCVSNCGNQGCHPEPKGCTDTFHYIDVLIDGKEYGQTYYFKL